MMTWINEEKCSETTQFLRHNPAFRLTECTLAAEKGLYIVLGKSQLKNFQESCLNEITFESCGRILRSSECEFCAICTAGYLTAKF